jgi:hypothetical protein
LKRALADHPWPLVTFGADDVRVFMDGVGDGLTLEALGEEADPFEPHFGWKGHVERRTVEAVAGS